MHENIITKFIDANILLDDTAYQKIKTHEDSLKFSESLIEELTPSKEDLLILTGEIIDQYLESDETYPNIANIGPKNNSLTQNKLVSSLPFDFQILRDASKKSFTNGEIKDFSAYFGSRFHKLKEILQHKKELKSSQTMRELENIQDEVKVIGMVNDVRTTKNNHRLFEIEDETGTAAVLVHKENHSLFEESERIVKDECFRSDRFTKRKPVNSVSVNKSWNSSC